MSWRIRAIGLYPIGGGQPRIINFQPDRLQIITGLSARGKSSVLDIIAYCLLSRSCTIPKGIIREHVSHVAIVCEKVGDRLVLLRAMPQEDELSSGAMHLERGELAWLPQTVPELRWNLDNAKEALGEFTGIEALPLLAGNADGDASVVGIRQLVPFLFQPQDVIASRNVTFPWLDDPFVRRHVLDALDYFLGLVTPETLQQRLELRRLLLEKRRADQSEEESRRLRASGFERGTALWNEAIALKLIPVNEEPASLAELLAELRRAATIEVGTPEVASEQLEFGAVQAEEKRLRAEYRAEELRLIETERYLESVRERNATMARQVDRLTIRDLFPTASSAKCPLCTSGTISSAEISEQLAFGITSLSSSGGDRTPRLNSRIEADRNTMRERCDEIRDRLKSLQERLMRLLPLQRPLLLTEEASRKRLFQGRVREYTEALDVGEVAPDPDADFRDRRIAELSKSISEESIRSKRLALQERLSLIISELILKLDVEFKGAAARLDLTKLTIEVNLRGKTWVPLSEIGSAANWLSYHLVVSIGLHQLFREQGSTVPPVLLLDQPSQVWFPSDSTTGGKDAEFEAVRRVYRLLYDCSTGDKFPQIIVVDHAHLSQNWFLESVCENWHQERALVPREWLSAF